MYEIVKSVSFGLENAYYDWCIAQIAKINDAQEIVTKFEKRAKNYELYFDKSTGFMRGKNEDGSWQSPFNPKYSSHEQAATDTRLSEIPFDLLLSDEHETQGCGELVLVVDG